MSAYLSPDLGTGLENRHVSVRQVVQDLLPAAAQRTAFSRMSKGVKKCQHFGTFTQDLPALIRIDLLFHQLSVGILCFPLSNIDQLDQLRPAAVKGANVHMLMMK